MRDEWTAKENETGGDSRSSQGLTRVGRQTESTAKATATTAKSGGLDRGASLTLARKGMRLKSKGVGDLKNREVSERRQVGDAESVVNQPNGAEGKGAQPWWRNVGMDEGL